AGRRTLRLYPRLLRTIPSFSFRLDDVLCDQFWIGCNFGGRLWQLSRRVRPPLARADKNRRSDHDLRNHCSECPGNEKERKPAECNHSTQSRRDFECCGYIQRSEEHTSELQSRENLVCRLLLEKKKTTERRR